ncbi:DnaJ-like protein [Aureococcus anophagefferens]|uniref:DnaJ-like protein n=2 Tax=Aureococcus anophagefferens TaxID=44056 RepID=A0ABR1FL31_AURAN
MRARAATARRRRRGRRRAGACSGVGPDKLDGDRAAREARRARVANHYEVLGVPRDADLAAITKAYKKKALETHPDKNLDDPDAEAKFLKVQEARVILSNKDARALYDLELGDDVDPGG